MTRTGPGKIRVDLALVDRGLAPSRARAQAMILRGLVKSGTRNFEKPGELVAENVPLEIISTDHPFVGRGGVKLAAALDHFGLSAEGRVCLDVGASTGGFTDCLLKRGAARVWAVDVGYGQFDWRLRGHERVHLLERTNFRVLPRDVVTDVIDLAVVDVSFISLLLIFPRLIEFLSPSARVVALVKPQFEAGRGAVGRGGVVRDLDVREAALRRVLDGTKALGFQCEGVMPSPILGRQGNQEYLVSLRVVRSGA